MRHGGCSPTSSAVNTVSDPEGSISVNLDLVWGLMIVVAGAVTLIALAPAALRAARTAYAESLDEFGNAGPASRQPDPAPSPRCIRLSDDPVWPIRPAA